MISPPPLPPRLFVPLESDGYKRRPSSNEANVSLDASIFGSLCWLTHSAFRFRLFSSSTLQSIPKEKTRELESRSVSDVERESCRQGCLDTGSCSLLNHSLFGSELLLTLAFILPIHYPATTSSTSTTSLPMRPTRCLPLSPFEQQLRQTLPRSC